MHVLSTVCECTNMFHQIDNSNLSDYLILDHAFRQFEIINLEILNLFNNCFNHFFIFCSLHLHSFLEGSLGKPLSL